LPEFLSQQLILGSYPLPNLFIIDTTSTQVDDIKSLLKEKLLEGEWVYSAQYEKYYEEPDPKDYMVGVGLLSYGNNERAVMTLI
jgi:hypothetical protein